MNARTTLADVTNLLKDARARGFEVKVDNSDVGQYTLHSIRVPRNPYSDQFVHVLAVVRHPRRGGRASARITTAVHSHTPGVKSVEFAGSWRAHWELREASRALYSWARATAVYSGSLDSSGL